MKKVRDGKAGLDPQTQRLVMSVLNDKTLLKTFAWVDELDHELDDAAEERQGVADHAGRRRGAPGAHGPAVGRRRPTPARSPVIASIARRASSARSPATASKIKYEILEAKGEQAVGRRRRHVASPSNHKEEPIIVDDEHFQWKFNGEYWKDELGYYRFKIRSRCPKQ